MSQRHKKGLYRLITSILVFLFVISPFAGVAAEEETGKVIVLNPGHSVGYDSGAVNSTTGITEAEVNEKLACALLLKLKNAGYTVYLTHCSNENYAEYCLGTMEDGNSLRKIGALCNSVNPDLALSIHHNAGSDTASGYEFYWSSYRDFDTVGVYEVDGLWSDGESAYRDSSPCEAAVQSQVFAEKLKDAFEDSQLPYRKTVERDDYLPAHAVSPCVLYEGGFISNDLESIYLISSDYIQDASDRILLAIDAFFSDDAAGDDTTGDETPGDDNTGDDNTSDDTVGDDTTGDDTTGDETPGDDTTGDETPGDDTTGDETPGDDTTGDETPGDDTTTGDETPGDDGTTGDEPGGDDQDMTDSIEVYRLYNPYTYEHLYTTDSNEYEILYKKHGWGQEGIGWYTLESGTPVYRLFQSGLDNHLYTTDLNEIKVLTTKYGWKPDNNGEPVFYSDGDIPIYRVYNAGLNGLHLLTTDLNEYHTLGKLGWKKEGEKISAVAIGNPYDETDYYNK